MILRSILHNTWIEWREQRGNLLGLWAGLVLLIIALALFGGADFINHHLAPMWFACLGCLAFTLAVTPRVFSRDERARCKGFLRRSPGGVHVSFMAKAVYLNIALALTALISLVVTLTVIYWLDPRTIETIGKVDSGWANVGMLLLTWHSVPLVLLAWGLPWRWSLVFSGVAALVIGASMYGAFLDAAAFQRSMSDFGLSDGAILTRVAMVLAPWVAAWLGYALRNDTGHAQRGLACLGALALVHAPAWGYYVPRALDYTDLDTSAEIFWMGQPILSPDLKSAFVEAGNGPMDAGGHRPFHGIRINLLDGTFEDLGYGGFRSGEFHWRQEGGFPSAPHLEGHLLASVLWPQASPPISWQRLNPNTGAVLELNRPLEQPEPWYPQAKALGIPSPWRVQSTPVGHGYLLYRQLWKYAIYDLHRQQLFHDFDLPMDVSSGLIVLPGKWLLAPTNRSIGWHSFDPDSGTFSPSEDLTPEDLPGPALKDGTVLIHRYGYCFLYDPATGERTPLAGGFIPGAEHTPIGPPQVSSVHRAPVADWYDLCLVTARKPLDDRHDEVSLGWLQVAEDSLTWFPWKSGNHVFGATDEHTILFLEDSRFIRSLDLATGETLTIFPR